MIGAGIVGMTTAYELASDGAEVVVFERRGSVAAEASFANAGLIMPGFMPPWSEAGMPGRALRQLLSDNAPIRLRAGLEPGTLRWLWQWWRACRSRTLEGARQRMQTLTAFSTQQLRRMTLDLQLDYERGEGCLVLLRSADDLAAAQPTLAAMRDAGARCDVLDGAACHSVEPNLNPKARLEAGIYFPDAEVGNCRQFAHLLRFKGRRLGVRFRFHTTVLRLHAGPTPQVVHRHAPPDGSGVLPSRSDFASLDAADTEPMPFEDVTENFDAIVVCAAMGAPALLHPHGVTLPLLAVRGHSVTAPLRVSDMYPNLGPRSAVIDAHHRVAVSRLGARVRVAGGAEIGGSAEHHRSGAFDVLYQVLHDWFPGAAQMSHAQRWKGVQPMLPDGPPVLGPSGVDGIWLNLGHGAHGWAWACGSARLLADALAGRPAAIDTDGFGRERLPR